MNEAKQQQLLAALVRDSNDAITVQDLEGNILAWNKGAVKMYGWSEQEALKMNIRQIVPPAKTSEARKLITRISQNKEVESFETTRLTADGRLLDVWLTVTALPDDQGYPTAVATTERDITAHKQTEKEKNDLIKQLQKALAEAKTLRGIIPICMICKKIRDDQGEWEEVEVYIHKHSGADFSHGICPDCLQEHFPKVYGKQLLLEGPKRKPRP